VGQIGPRTVGREHDGLCQVAVGPELNRGVSRFDVGGCMLGAGRRRVIVGGRALRHDRQVQASNCAGLEYRDGSIQQVCDVEDPAVFAKSQPAGTISNGDAVHNLPCCRIDHCHLICTLDRDEDPAAVRADHHAVGTIADRYLCYDGTSRHIDQRHTAGSPVGHVGAGPRVVHGNRARVTAYRQLSLQRRAGCAYEAQGIGVRIDDQDELAIEGDSDGRAGAFGRRGTSRDLYPRGRKEKDGEA